MKSPAGCRVLLRDHGRAHKLRRVGKRHAWI